MEVVNQAALFAHWSEAAKRTVAATLQPKHVSVGQYLIQQGQALPGLFFLARYLMVPVHFLLK